MTPSRGTFLRDNAFMVAAVALPLVVAGLFILDSAIPASNPDVQPVNIVPTLKPVGGSPVEPPPPFDVIVGPVRTRTVRPGYPAGARARQLEGDVRLRVVVGADGRVGDVTVVGPVHPLLDAAARTAVLRYEYTPGLRNGVPESATVPITVSFRLR